MNPIRIIIVALCLILSLFSKGQAQEMDKELSEVATKLAALTKENGKKKITVLDFTDLQGGSTELGRYVAEQLTVNLVMVKKDFSVLDRANLKKILAEHKLTTTGLIDPENAKKLGQFAGVDALILGTITPKNQKINLTAKIITTDTAEIVGAAKADFTSDQAVQDLLSQAARPEAPAVTNESRFPPTSPAPKPFGELQAKVDSFQLTPGDRIYGFARVILTITNTSTTTTYGVGINPNFYNTFNLSNSRGDEFKATEVSGIETAYEGGDGMYYGSFTDIPPKSAIKLVSKSQVRWTGKPGDYRPYQLQTVVLFSEESTGRYPQKRKYNLLVDIK